MQAPHTRPARRRKGRARNITPERKRPARPRQPPPVDHRFPVFPSSVEMNAMVQEHFAPYRVRDEALVAWGRRTILEMYKLPADMTYFPGALPVSLMRKDLSYITDMPYMVAEKTDGVRHLLWACRDDKHTYTFLIDRGFRFYFAFVKFTTHLTQGSGTLLDGEVIKEATGYKYYAHDIMSMAGNTQIALQPYQQRMRRVADLVRWHCFPPDNAMHDLGMYAKQVYPLRNLHDLWYKIMPRLPHRSDGLILTPNGLPHTGKKNKLLFKWKAPGDNTIDLRLADPVDAEPDYTAVSLDGLGDPYQAYKLQTWDTSEYFDFCEIAMSSERWYAIEVGQPDERAGIILECRFNFERNLWVPVNIRQDKIVPNDVTTIRKTIEAMVENLTIDELLNISRHAREVHTPAGGGMGPNMVYDPSEYYAP